MPEWVSEAEMQKEREMQFLRDKIRGWRFSEPGLGESVYPGFDVGVLIDAEMIRQDARWGEQHHKLPGWFLIASEEVGEVAKAILQLEIWRDEEKPHTAKAVLLRSDLREEIVQTMAVLSRMLMVLDREEVDPEE